MKYSCCVCDLDGTLLNSNNQISPYDLEVLLKLQNKGIPLIIATGRIDLLAMQYISELQIKIPTVTCNGGLIRNKNTGEILHESYLDSDIARELIEYCNLRFIDYVIYTLDRVYYPDWSRRIKIFQNYNMGVIDEFKVPISLVNDLPNNYKFDNIVKILLVHNISIQNEVNQLFNRENKLTVVTSGNNLVDVMTSNTTKGRGLEIITKNLGIPISETVVFGDSENDLSMFEAAGFSVAMGNAADSIKKAADYVTKSNDDCGVAYGVLKLFK